MELVLDPTWTTGVGLAFSVVFLMFALAMVTMVIVFSSQKMNRAIIPITIVFLLVGLFGFHYASVQTHASKSWFSDTPVISSVQDSAKEQLESAYGAKIISMGDTDKYSDGTLKGYDDLIVYGDTVNLRWERNGQEELCSVIPDGKLKEYGENIYRHVDVFCHDVLVKPNKVNK